MKAQMSILTILLCITGCKGKPRDSRPVQRGEFDQLVKIVDYRDDRNESRIASLETYMACSNHCFRFDELEQWPDIRSYRGEKHSRAEVEWGYWFSCIRCGLKQWRQWDDLTSLEQRAFNTLIHKKG